jgi:hypothetical protein
MTDYFAALAARTLRPELSVQPPHRVLWEAAAEPTAEVFRAAEKRIADDGARPTVSDEGEPARRSRRKSTAEPSRPESEAVARRRGQESGKRKGASDHEHPATAPPPHPTVRALEQTMQVRFERVAARPDDARGKRPPPASERAEVTTRASGIERARPLPARVSTRERESTTEPDIRIHIGRVDVRAVTTPVPGSSPPASRNRERALMSLDEYVHKRDRGVS